MRNEQRCVNGPIRRLWSWWWSVVQHFFFCLHPFTIHRVVVPLSCHGTARLNNDDVMLVKNGHRTPSFGLSEFAKRTPIHLMASFPFFTNFEESTNQTHHRYTTVGTVCSEELWPVRYFFSFIHSHAALPKCFYSRYYIRFFLLRVTFFLSLSLSLSSSAVDFPFHAKALAIWCASSS